MCMTRTFQRLLSEHKRSTMNSWWCHSGWRMHRQRFKALWTTCSGLLTEIHYGFFIYDILVYSQSWEDHVRHLHTFLSILEDNNLFAKENKSIFGVTKVEYLGHVISSEGVEPDPAKIEAVQCWPLPSTVHEVRRFLGLAGYYWKFIRHFGSNDPFLNWFLTKEGFHWTPEAATAF